MGTAIPTHNTPPTSLPSSSERIGLPPRHATPTLNSDLAIHSGRNAGSDRAGTSSDLADNGRKDKGGASGSHMPLALSPRFARMPVVLSVGVPVREFRVRNLLALAPGLVLQTKWESTEDLPLTSGNVQLAWSEFEVTGTQLSVRITRLI